MKLKKYMSLILALVIFTAVLPIRVFAEEYISLKDIAEANGYEYFYYEDNDSVNMRSATYILSFQKDNDNVGYKTVVGEVGVIVLKNKVKAEGDTLYISKTDAQTKLIRQFPNTPSSSESKPSSPTKSPQSNFPSGSAPSDWAREEVQRASANDLVTANTKKNYQADISREYFCELVVRLYEKITNDVVSADSNPFKDTHNTEIIKAYKLGIVNGVSATEFAPDNSITRQEICAMLVRAIGAMFPGIDLNDYQNTSFRDSGSIASWAMDSVQFAYDNNIMNGVGDNKIDPLGHATCEQAILLVNRIYENRNNLKDKEAVLETLKRLEFEDNSEVNSVSVSFSDGRDTSNVRIREINSDDLIYTTTGLKGPAVSITTKEDFDTATIAFDYNPSGLDGTNPNDLTIGWYNTDLDRIELLESNVNTAEHTVSVETTHFSEYVLVDSKEWYSVWQRGQTIVRETDRNGDYAENFNVQLVIDCSGSMDGSRISSAKECTYNFITKLSDYDKFSVIKFEDRAQTVIPSSLMRDTNLKSVKDTIMSVSGGGGTEFNEALNECINTLDTSDSDYNNIIVFLSDGGSDVDSSLLDTLRYNDVRIAAVALGNGSNTDRMKQLSDSTNGQYVFADDSSDLDTIYDAIQGSLIGVDATDTDGDGLPDIIETTGMKNQYGCVIRTDPNLYDTDGDGASDGEEMGMLIETDELTDMDRKHGITSNVYFLMVSDPVEGHRVADKVDATAELRLTVACDDMDSNGMFTLHFNLEATNDVNDFYIKFDTDNCVDWEMNKIEFLHTDFDGNMYKEYLQAGVYQFDLEMWCDELYRGLPCSNKHKISIYAVAENADKISTSVTVPNNASATATPSPTGVSRKAIDDYEIDIAKASKKISESIYNNANTKAQTSEDIIEKRENFKKQISKPANALPNEVYDALAADILNNMSSSIDEFETNPNKLTEQIGKKLSNTVYQGSTTAKSGNLTYKIEYTLMSAFGMGDAYIDVTGGGHPKEHLCWTNTNSDDGIKAFAAYCAALAQLNTDVWKDFLAYYVSDAFGLMNIKTVTKDNVRNVLDKAEKVIKALCDKDDANKLIEEMGDEIKNKLLSGGMFWDANKFEEFVKENVPNGKLIIDAAKKYQKVKKKYDDLVDLFNTTDKQEQAQKAYDELIKLYNELENITDSL